MVTTIRDSLISTPRKTFIKPTITRFIKNRVTQAAQDLKVQGLEAKVKLIGNDQEFREVPVTELIPQDLQDFSTPKSFREAEEALYSAIFKNFVRESISELQTKIQQGEKEDSEQVFQHTAELLWILRIHPWSTITRPKN